MERNELFMLTICINQTPVGLIDIHNIDLQNIKWNRILDIRKMKIKGFVKQKVKELIKIIPSKFKIDKLLIYIDVDNVK